MRPWQVKLDRADEHLAALEGEVAEYLQGGAAGLTVEQDPGQPGVFDLRLRLHRPPPLRWSAVAGDVLHNVRSALDSLIFALLTERSGQPLTDKQQRAAQFPITKDAAAFARTDWHKGAADEQLIAAVRELQAWNDMETLQLADGDAERLLPNHPLSLLQKWSNVDKHRTLHTAVTGLDTFHVGLPTGVAAEWLQADPWPWRDGSLVTRVRLTGLPAGADPEFGFQFTVALEEDLEPLRAPPLVDRLRIVRSHADFIVWRLQALLPEQP